MAQRRTTFLSTAVLIVAAATPALAQPTQTQPAREIESDGLPAILIDAQLIARPVTITAIDDTSVSYRDEQGREKRAPAAGLAALLPRDPAPASPRPAPPGALGQSQPTVQSGTLLLTDGQRFPGKLTPTSGDPDVVSWTHPTFGLITIPLDNVARLRQPAMLEPDGTARPGAAASANSDAEDQLFLVNGDRLSGFLAGLGNPVQIEVNGDTLSIPPDRIAAAALSNPRAPAKGLTVWLADGTVAALQRASSAAAPAPGGNQSGAKPAPQTPIPTPQSRTTLTLTLSQAAAGATPGTYNLSDLRAVAFDIARLRPISSLPARAQRPLGERRFAAPMEMVNAETSDPLALAAVGVPLDAYDLYFPGPMSVTLDLPERAERLAGEFELDPLAGIWADCDVVLYIDAGEAWRARLSRAGEPGAPSAAAFNLPIPALSAASASSTPRTLTIAIEPARFGPVMDRVYLRRGLVLLAK